GDSMVTGQFVLLPELAAAMTEADRRCNGETSWERAESFARLLGESGKQQTTVVFHMDTETNDDGDLTLGKRCELKGVGPVVAETAIDRFREASLKFVGTLNNKLEWFSEQDRRSKTKELPEFIKRAVISKARDRCEVSGCVGVAAQVDHITARCND